MSTHNPSNKKSNSLQVARYFWQHAKAYPLYLTGAVLSIPFTVLVSGILPALIIADVLSKLSQHHYEAHSIWASFGPELSLYVGLLFLGIAVWRIVDMFMWRLEMSIQQDIAEEVFRHMLGRSADFHANNFGGSLVSRTNKLLGGYVRVADTALYSTYPMLASIVLSIAILLSRAPLFAAILATFAVIYIAIAFAISRPVRELSTKFATAESAQTGLLADAISNVMTIKSFARSTFENQRFHAATHETRQRLSAFARMHQRQMGTLGVLNRTISGAALVSAVVAVMLFKANIGTVFLILSYTSTIVDQLFQFSNNGLRNYSRAFGDAGDMVATLAEPQEIQDPTQPEAPRINRGAILFEDVTFTHDGANDAIFEKLRLSIKPGEKIGLIGHSGSGKSTFTRLLLRFSDIENGAILLDDQNIAHITQEDLHRHIAYVPQEPLLFHRSIKENIAYGQTGASDEAVIAAAKMASADEFITLLPQGYDTLVGERGVKLSGGQRQRVAIARAMLKNAPILLLDEATSALDSESEVLIQAALWKLMEGRTAIIIAHRLSTIQKMDRILVMDDGKIVEEGSHKELLQAKGTYAKLWAHQSGGFIDE